MTDLRDGERWESLDPPVKLNRYGMLVLLLAIAGREGEQPRLALILEHGGLRIVDPGSLS